MRLWSLAACLGLVACGGKAISDGNGPDGGGGHGAHGGSGGAHVFPLTGGAPSTGGVVGPTGGAPTGGGDGMGSRGKPICDGDWPHTEPCSLGSVGVNLSGAEFGQNVPGTFGQDYIYPGTADVAYFAARGMDTVRLPFLWERLQRSPGAAFDADELARLENVVALAKDHGMSVILDPHNYARYRINGVDHLIGDGVVTVSHFADLWTKLASEFGGQGHVLFGLMNEPHDMSTSTWVDAANAAIAAIRNAGALNLVLVPGNHWTGAHSWTTNGNSQAMLGIVDPLENHLFEVHQYFDANFSGGSESCSHVDGEALVGDLTAWLRMHGKRAFLGEFGGGSGADCQESITSVLSYLERNADVWSGWTYWAGGPWWGDYFTSITPGADGRDKPQMT